jgi:fluoride ion exporter CrcB/FEX
MLRYVLSRYNAWRRCTRFPFFTFLVNVVGSIGLALTVVSIDLRGYNIDTDVPGYTLRGFQVGFFGTFLLSLLLCSPT